MTISILLNRVRFPRTVGEHPRFGDLSLSIQDSRAPDIGSTPVILTRSGIACRANELEVTPPMSVSTLAWHSKPGTEFTQTQTQIPEPWVNRSGTGSPGTNDSRAIRPPAPYLPRSPLPNPRRWV